MYFVCVLTVLLTPGFCEMGTVPIEVEGATGFTVRGDGNIQPNLCSGCKTNWSVSGLNAHGVVIALVMAATAGSMMCMGVGTVWGHSLCILGSQ